MPAQNSLIPEMNSFEGFGSGIGDIELTNYGYSNDHTPDTNSNVKRTGRGGTRPLTPGFSVAIDRGLEERLNIKVGALLRIWDANGDSRIVENADRVPDSSVDGKGTFDVFLPDSGRNDFYGKIAKIEVLAQGDGRTDEEGALNTLGTLANMFPEEAAKMADRILGQQSSGEAPQESKQAPQQQAEGGQEVPGHSRLSVPRIDPNAEAGAMNQPVMDFQSMSARPEYKGANAAGRVEALEGWRKQLHSRYAMSEEETFKVNHYVDAKIESELAGRGRLKEFGKGLQEGAEIGVNAARAGINETVGEVTRMIWEKKAVKDQLKVANKSLEQMEESLGEVTDRFSDLSSFIARADDPEEKKALLDEAKELKVQMRAQHDGVRFVEDQIADIKKIGKDTFENSDNYRATVVRGFIEDQEGQTAILADGAEKIREKTRRSESYKKAFFGLLDPASVAMGELPILMAQSASVPGRAVMVLNMGKRRADEIRALDPEMTQEEYLTTKFAAGTAEMLIEGFGVQRMFKGAAKATSRRLLKAMAEEGVEEVMQSVAGLEIGSAITGTDIETGAEIFKVLLGEDPERVWHPEALVARAKEFAIGAIVATPMVGIQKAGQKLQSDRLRKEADRDRENVAKATTPAQVEQSTEDSVLKEEVANEIDNQAESGEADAILREIDEKRKKRQEESKAPPVEEAPVEETPVEETAAEETTEEAPVEEAPVEEATAEEAPVEETPVEEETTEETTPEPKKDPPPKEEEAPEVEAEETPAERVSQAKIKLEDARNALVDPGNTSTNKEKLAFIHEAKRELKAAEAELPPVQVEDSTPEVTEDATLDSQDTAIDESSPPEATAEVVAQGEPLEVTPAPPKEPRKTLGSLARFEEEAVIPETVQETLDAAPPVEEGKKRKNVSLDNATSKVAEIQEVIEKMPTRERRRAEDRFAEAFTAANRIAGQKMQGRDTGGAGEFGDVETHALGLTEARLNEQGRSILDEDLDPDELGKLLNSNTKFAVLKATSKAVRSSGGETVTHLNFDAMQGHWKETFDGEEFTVVEEDSDPATADNEGSGKSPAWNPKLQIPLDDISQETQDLIKASQMTDNSYDAGLVLFPEMIDSPRKKVQDKYNRRLKKARTEMGILADEHGKSYQPSVDNGFAQLAAILGGGDALGDLIDAEADGFLSVEDVAHYLVELGDGEFVPMLKTLLASEEVAEVMSLTPFETTSGPNKGVGGAFNRDSRGITMTQGWRNPDLASTATSTLTHEIIHLMTERALKDPNSEFSKLVRSIRAKFIKTLPQGVQDTLEIKTAQEIVLEMNAGMTHEEIYGVPPAEGDSNLAGLLKAYAASNDFEMTAMGMTSPPVMMALAAVPSTRPRFFKGAWEQLVDGFKKFFNISGQSDYTDLLENFMTGAAAKGEGQATMDFLIKQEQSYQQEDAELWNLLNAIKIGDEDTASNSPVTAGKKKSKDRTIGVVKKRQAEFAKYFKNWDALDDYEGETKKALIDAAKLIERVNPNHLTKQGRRGLSRYIRDFTGRPPTDQQKGRLPEPRALFKAASSIQADIAGSEITALMRKGDISKPSITGTGEYSSKVTNDTSIERLLANTKRATEIVRKVTASFTDGVRGTAHRGSIYARGQTTREVKNLEENFGGKYLTKYEDHVKPNIRNHLFTISPELEAEGILRAEQVYRNYANLLASTENVDALGLRAPRQLREENVINKRLLREFRDIARNAYEGKSTFSEAQALADAKLNGNQKLWAKGQLELFSTKKSYVQIVTDILNRKGAKTFKALEGYVPLVARSFDHDTEVSSIDFENPEETINPEKITERHLTHGFHRKGIGSNHYVFSGKETVRAALDKINQDFHTLPQRQMLGRLFSKADRRESIHGKVDRGNKAEVGVVQVLRHVATKQVNNELNKSRLGGGAVKAINEIKSIAYPTILAHVKQPFNQLAPLVAYAIVNPTKAVASLTHAFTAMKPGNSMVREWGTRNAHDVFSRELDSVLDDIRRSSDQLKVEPGTVKAYRGFRKTVDLMGHAYIGISDKMATEGIFVGEYIAAARKNGTITEATYEAAFADTSKVDEDALLKARRAVTAFNAESATAKKGSVFQRQGGDNSLIKELGRNSLFVFSTMQASIASNINASIHQIRYGKDKETVAEGYKGLMAGLVSEAAFVGIASGLFHLLAFGADDEKEREKIYAKAYSRGVDSLYTSLPGANLALLNTIVPEIADYVIDSTPASRYSKQFAGALGFPQKERTKLRFQARPTDLALDMAGVPGLGIAEYMQAAVLTANASSGDMLDLLKLYSTFLVGQPKDLLGLYDTGLDRPALRRKLQDKAKD